jgi:hypothetical protein
MLCKLLVNMYVHNRIVTVSSRGVLVSPTNLCLVFTQWDVNKFWRMIQKDHSALWQSRIKNSTVMFGTSTPAKVVEVCNLKRSRPRIAHWEVQSHLGYAWCVHLSLPLIILPLAITCSISEAVYCNRPSLTQMKEVCDSQEMVLQFNS